MPWPIKKLEKLEFHDWDGFELTYQTSKDEQAQLVGINTKFDPSLFIYPIHTLTTNRMCDTLISRQNQRSQPWIRFHTDLGNIRSVSGVMIGFVPYCMSHFVHCWDYSTYV